MKSESLRDMVNMCFDAMENTINVLEQKLQEADLKNAELEKKNDPES